MNVKWLSVCLFVCMYVTLHFFFSSSLRLWYFSSFLKLLLFHLPDVAWYLVLLQLSSFACPAQLCAIGYPSAVCLSVSGRSSGSYLSDPILTLELLDHTQHGCSGSHLVMAFHVCPVCWHQSGFFI